MNKSLKCKLQNAKCKIPFPISLCNSNVSEVGLGSKSARLNNYVASVLILFLFLFPLLLFASDITDFYNTGNKAYSDGDFTAAIENYTQAITSSGHNPSLYYNLGNAYFKSGDIGRAILNYNRAKLLAPRSDEINFNLQFAKSVRKDEIQSVYDGFVYRIFYDILYFFNSFELRNVIIAISIILTLFIALYIYKRKNLFKGISITFGVLLIIFVILLILQLSDSRFQKRGVVIADQSTSYSAPQTDSEILFLIHSGAEVILEESRGEWLKIRLEDGKVGWTKKEGIERVKIAE